MTLNFRIVGLRILSFKVHLKHRSGSDVLIIHTLLWHRNGFNTLVNKQVHARDTQGYTALHRSCYHGDHLATKMLLHRKADATVGD